MLLQVCTRCSHGTVRDGQSHCGKESVYSIYSRCIQRLALGEFLDRSRVGAEAGQREARH